MAAVDKILNEFSLLERPDPAIVYDRRLFNDTLFEFFTEHPDRITPSRQRAMAYDLTIGELINQKVMKGKTHLYAEKIINKQAEEYLLELFCVKVCGICEGIDYYNDEHECNRNIRNLNKKRLEVLEVFCQKAVEEHNSNIDSSTEFHIKNLDNKYKDLFATATKGIHYGYRGCFNSEGFWLFRRDNPIWIPNQIVERMVFKNAVVNTKHGEIRIYLDCCLADNTFLNFPKLEHSLEENLIDHACRFIENSFSIDLEMSKAYRQEIGKILYFVPLTLVSLACWQARQRYLVAEDDGFGSNRCRNIAKSELKKRLQCYADDPNRLDPRKYARYVDIDDTLCNYLDDYEVEYDFDDLVCLPPCELEEKYLG